MWYIGYSNLSLYLIKGPFRKFHNNLRCMHAHNFWALTISIFLVIFWGHGLLLLTPRLKRICKVWNFMFSTSWSVEKVAFSHDHKSVCVRYITTKYYLEFQSSCVFLRVIFNNLLSLFLNNCLRYED